MARFNPGLYATFSGMGRNENRGSRDYHRRRAAETLEMVLAEPDGLVKRDLFEVVLLVLRKMGPAHPWELAAAVGVPGNTLRSYLSRWVGSERNRNADGKPLFRQQEDGRYALLLPGHHHVRAKVDQYRRLHPKR